MINMSLCSCRSLQAPYDENDLGMLEILFGVRQDEAIMTQRNLVEADLVQVIAHFDEPYCGVG